MRDLLYLWARGMVLAFGMATPALAAPINIGNLVWNDLDRDGRQDAGEPGMEGIVVQLWNGSKTQLIQTVRTNATGLYTLVAPGAGDYRVRVLLPYAGDVFTLMDDFGASDITDSDIKTSGPDYGFTGILSYASNVISVTSVDIGVVPDPMKDHTIGDRVFRAGENHTQGPGGTSSVQVDLLNAAGVVVQTTTSTSSGHYSFLAPPGLYRLRFGSPAGMSPCEPDAGTDDAIDSDIDEHGYTSLFALRPGEVRRDLDAGYFFDISIGNLIWRDTNGDGLQTAGEPGIPDVVVELWKGDKSKRLDWTTTNANGNYALRARGPGTYRIWVLRPLPTDSFVTKGVGGNIQIDSNVYPAGVDFGFSDPFSLASNVISTTTHDAGITWPDAGRRLVTPLRMTSILKLGSTVRLGFQGPAGGLYRVEWSEDLDEWLAFSSEFATTNTAASTTVPVPEGAAEGHFRMRRTR